MSAERISDPQALLAASGYLHDVRIDKIDFAIEEKIVTLNINDLNASFTESSRYLGCRPSKLIFMGVDAFLLDVELSEGIRIAKASIAKGSRTNLLLAIDLNLGGGDMTRGRQSLKIDFASLLLAVIKGDEIDQTRR